MKATKLLLAATLAAASLGAMANGQEVSGPEHFQSTLSRAQVQADLAAYRQAGVNPWSSHYNHLAGFSSARSRADVRAEYLASRDEVAALTGEDSGSAYLAHTAARRVDAGTSLAGQPRNSAK